MDAKQIFIVVPTYNEATVIEETLRPLIENGYSVVVVDDGSCDGTREKVENLPVFFLRHIVNLGQGAALQTGMDFAASMGAEVIVHFDADGQHDFRDIGAFVRPITENQTDVVLGSRFLRDDDMRAIPPLRRILLRAATRLTMLLSGIRLTDTHNGFRAFSKNAAARIRIRENNMAHASEILHQISRAKLRYTEVPVHVRYTEYSKQKGQSMFNSVNILFDFLLGRFLR